jgi:hypothetical protein
MKKKDVRRETKKKSGSRKSYGSVSQTSACD